MGSYHYIIISLTVVLDGIAEEAKIWWKFVGTLYSYAGKEKFLIWQF